MKTLVKMPFFRLALLVLVITILGLLLKKYVVNRERFFYTNGNSGFAVPVGLNQDGTIMFKLISEFEDETNSNGIVDKIIKNLTVWKKKDGSDTEFEQETKDIRMCQLCYKKTINDEEKCMYDVWNKTQETNNDGTTSDIYNRTNEMGCPDYCDTNSCPETPKINVTIPNSSGGGSSNKEKYVKKNINGKEVMHVNCGKITDHPFCAAHVYCDYCGTKCISTKLRDKQISNEKQQKQFCSISKKGRDPTRPGNVPSTTEDINKYCAKSNQGNKEYCYEATDDLSTWNSIKNSVLKTNEGSSTSVNKSAGTKSTTGTSNYPSTFSGSLNHLSKIMNQKLAENTIRVSGNEVNSSMNVINKLSTILEESEHNEINTFRNFSYDGNINTPAPFDTSYKPQTGSSSLSEFSKYKNYL